MKKLDIEPKQHHPFSPSSLQAREACPRYAGTNNESEASRAGTMQHAAAEVGEDNEHLSDAQAFAVADCQQYYKNLLRGIKHPLEIREQYLPIDDEVHIHPDTKKPFTATTAGYLDLAVVDLENKVAHIVDWKFGLWSVEPTANNVQGISYLLGLVRKLELEQNVELESVTVHFVLPHRDEVDTHTFYRAEFPSLYLRIKTIVARAVDPTTEATPTNKTCCFCANLARCKKAHEIILKVGKKYAPILIPDNISPSLLNDPKEVSQGLQVASLVESWAKAYKTQANNKTLEDPNFTPEGYQLVKFCKREIVSLPLLRKEARKFLTEDEIDGATKISLTPLESAIAAKAPRGSKDAAKAIFGDALKAAGAVQDGPEIAFLKMIKV